MKMTTTGPDSSARAEEHKVSGDKLLEKVKEIIREGNARKIIIKNDAGNSLMEIPLTFGMVGVFLAPVFVAIGTIAALAGHYTIVVEKKA